MHILIVEDQTMVRDLLARECGAVFPAAAISVAGDGNTALAKCAKRAPDVILLDLVLPDCDGLDLVEPIFDLAPGSKIIALSSHLDEFTLHRAGRLRVHGMIDKNEQPVRVLAEAIDSVLRGHQYISPAVSRLRASLRADPFAFDKVLSAREQQMLQLVGQGLTNDEVARRWSVSATTAKKHRLRIMAKLDLHSTPELIRYAIEKGFTRPPTRSNRAPG